MEGSCESGERDVVEAGFSRPRVRTSSSDGAEPGKPTRSSTARSGNVDDSAWSRRLCEEPVSSAPPSLSRRASICKSASWGQGGLLSRRVCLSDPGCVLEARCPEYLSIYLGILRWANLIFCSLPLLHMSLTSSRLTDATRGAACCQPSPCSTSHLSRLCCWAILPQSQLLYRLRCPGYRGGTRPMPTASASLATRAGRPRLSGRP